tara:strand:- start:1051 stop:1893 length:843 start_codon:yes stop_codon:yes gene_type:complete
MDKKLGKGLAALIKSYESDKPDLLRQGIPINQIIPNKNQPRQVFNDSKMESLIQSIIKIGVLQPIAVRKINNQYELIAGERRFRAAQKANLKTIPAYVLSINNESEMMEYALIENIQRVDLNPIEEAEGYAILSGKYNLTHSVIAESVSKSRSEVSNKLRLLKLPPKVKESLKKTDIEYGHARALLSLKASTEILKIFNLIIKLKLNVRQTEILIKKLKSTKTNNNNKESSYNKVEIDLQQFLDTKVTINKKNKKIIIKFQSDKDLNRIIKKIKKNNFFL